MFISFTCELNFVPQVFQSGSNARNSVFLLASRIKLWVGESYQKSAVIFRLFNYILFDRT
jgi:hypothetical protein